ncbi:MAG: ABC transporter ATP-binding protein [Kiloniellales bacterium]|nr:ABC transporter ATP-binding protein [Kiloniellales bacterium]
MSLLSAMDLHGGYGGDDVLRGVSLRVDDNEIVVIVGPNGAGKSTAMKALFGFVRLRRGTVSFGGSDITNLPPEEISALGLGYVPQERNVFPNLTIEENLEMGVIRRPAGKRQAMDRVFTLFPPLAERRKAMAGVLSGGQRQMLAIGRALMIQPKLLMLDEPTAGLSPLFIDQMFEQVGAIHRAGVSILMVEQNARQALEIATRGYVLVGGADRYEGPGPALLADREVVQSFLGG